jgi:hypothetical protein
MAEPIQPATATGASVHNKVAIPAFVGALASFGIYIGKAKFGLDLSGQEANLIVILMAFTGWLVPGGAQ